MTLKTLLIFSLFFLLALVRLSTETETPLVNHFIYLSLHRKCGLQLAVLALGSLPFHTVYLSLF